MRIVGVLSSMILLAITTGVLAAESPVVGLDRYYHHETRNGKPYHYAWEDTSPAGYSQLATLIQGLGARAISVTKPASRETLSGLSVYMIVAPDTQKTVQDPNYLKDDAIEAIVTWVKAGGVLVLLNNDKDHAEFTHMNKLAGRFGVTFNEDVRFGVNADPKNLQMHSFPEHPFFQGVKKLHMRSICTLSVRPPAEAIYRFQGDGIMALSKFGQGTVFALGDPWGYNEYIGFFDNRAGLTNVFRELLAASVRGRAEGAELKYKERLLTELVRHVPQLLKSYDSKTGSLGTGLWTCSDQNLMYPCAVAYATPGAGNRYYKSRELLEVIVKAGDCLIANANAKGQWMFTKKDGSTWGMIWMPWTYSRWIRTYGLVAQDMPPERREAWKKALLLGYTGIASSQWRSIHNIPTHHAMGLYAAGKALDRPEWCEQASQFMMKVVGAQSELGYWSEGAGPVVAYNMVYVEALGTYYAMSGDRRVLSSLERAANYHYHLTYPDGRSVETLDQRNPYHGAIDLGNVGFTFTPIGRAHLARQWAKQPSLGADLMASLLLHGQEGPVASMPAEARQDVFTFKEGDLNRAAVVRHGPWFVCLSAYTVPVENNRWHQDRQSFVSIFHEKVGLILGGGNTKLQPLWSNFTVGDVSLLQHRPGDINPAFLPPAGKLFHVPSAAALVVQPELGLDLTYGAGQCQVRLRPVDESTMVYHLATTGSLDMPVAAHLTLLPRLGKQLETGAGVKLTADSHPIHQSADQLRGSVAFAGYRLTLPATATLDWPCLPHNPYRKDGHAEPSEGRIVITIPLDSQHREYDVRITVLP